MIAYQMRLYQVWLKPGTRFGKGLDCFDYQSFVSQCDLGASSEKGVKDGRPYCYVTGHRIDVSKLAEFPDIDEIVTVESPP